LTLELLPYFRLLLMSASFTIQTFWSAGKLADAVGVSTDTLRHYERKGVLPRPRRAANGYRQYPETALERVLLVRRALAIGFTLDELARILNECDRGGTPCRDVRKLVDDKLKDVEKQLVDITALRDELRRIGLDWDSRLSGTSPDGKFRLLESLKSDEKFEHTKLPLHSKIKKRK